MAAGMLRGHDDNMLFFTAPCLLLYGAIFALTCYGRVQEAGYGLNVICHTGNLKVSVRQIRFYLIYI